MLTAVVGTSSLIFYQLHKYHIDHKNSIDRNKDKRRTESKRWLRLKKSDRLWTKSIYTNKSFLIIFTKFSLLFYVLKNETHVLKEFSKDSGCNGAGTLFLHWLLVNLKCVRWQFCVAQNSKKLNTRALLGYSENSSTNRFLRAQDIIQYFV